MKYLDAHFRQNKVNKRMKTKMKIKRLKKSNYFLAFIEGKMYDVGVKDKGGIL